jgi:hypothetical protein
MFLDQNNIRRFFYISESGMDGSISLNEFQNAHPAESPPETVPYEPTDVEETSSVEFQMDGTTLVRYTGDGGDVTIPSTVTVIGEAAFIVVLGAGRSPASVTIPSSVGRIWIGAFEECASLTSVTMSSRTDVAGDAFPENVQINYRD